MIRMKGSRGEHSDLGRPPRRSTANIGVRDALESVSSVTAAQQEGGMDSTTLLIIILVIIWDEAVGVGMGGADGSRRAVREARKCWA